MSHVSTHSYKKVTSILDTIAKVKLCLVMMDLECDALVVEMFQRQIVLIELQLLSLNNKLSDCGNITEIKVRKYGNALGRSVGLMRFDGYDEMISELDHMFDFKGSLINGSSGWHVTFTDDEGDMEFCLMVRKMLVYPKEEIDRQNPGSPDPTPL
ncbi:auxin response factor 2a [Quercus suber]|uniref:Auxin response factor 2a n=1 Tax=Quercus suber TaxID=58331 RepID=A0AAW0K9T8_QUESU